MMRRDELRTALYHRLYFLVPLVSHQMAGKVGRALIWLFWLLYFGFVLLVLGLRYSILPHIEDYRPDIERLVSQGLGQAVSIGRIEASWKGINPDLNLLDVQIADADGRPALAFSRVEAILSWWSIPSARLKLRLLRIDEPALNIRRDSQGQFFVAGIALNKEQSDADVSGWILDQRRIRIRGATLVWEDELRKAPPLILEDVNFALDNDGNRHRFGLTALPPEGLASKIDLRGDFHGADLEHVARWSGRGYAEIDYADLAVWRTWVDYPVDLPRGRGGVRAWLGFTEGGLREVTADLSLQDVSLRLSADLPALELNAMSGRISTRLFSDGFEVNGRQIALATRPVAIQKNGAPELQPAIRVQPTDFSVAWEGEAGSDGRKGAGSVAASRLDLGVLSKLAEYLPFDAKSRQLLNDYAPRGRISSLVAKWSGDSESLQTYSMKAGFEELALKAQGYFPGFSGLSGGLELNERGGSASLRAGKSSIDLPSVFPESLISFDKLNAQTKWKVRQGELDVEVSRVEFSGPDADGTAQGKYRSKGQGPGVIDLTAALTRGEAKAVWRYMPHAVNANARYWLRDSLLGGHASEAKLTLKGDLANFPFLDKSQGQFLVTVKANDATLEYGKGWPKITGVKGDLRFEGNGMIIDAHQGSILGASLSGTRAEIPDFDAPVSTLKVKGKATGPTAQFLKFIDQSPVAERIDHFTEDMRARGEGHLDLDLAIPLEEARLADSKINGTYRFLNNEVMVDSALPWLRQVNGSVQFSGSDLQIPEINANLFGGPLKIKGGAQKDGRVLITTNGSINIEQARQQSSSPLLARLSGASPYRGEIRINKRNADLVIDSNLVGLASSLPEPFSKKASESLPLRFEKKLLGTVAMSKASGSIHGVRQPDARVRDQISASLGKVLSVQLIRRKQKEGFVAERGAIAVGRPLQLPESGVSLGLTAKQLDLDIWRRLLSSTSDASQSEEQSPSLPLDTVNINTPDLVLFGRHFNDVDLTAFPAPSQWKIRLNSRQINGGVIWDSTGSGKVSARFKQMTIDPSAETTGTPVSEAMDELPAIDLVADDFSLGPRHFGRLELQASNEGGVWRLHKILASNPGGSFSGSGSWQFAGGVSHTRLEFKVDSSDVGKLLERMGYPGTVRAGAAQLNGKIAWDGRPVDLDFASLSGDMSLEASKGQFVKLNPGAAGKLLGLISLQGLPRRITLDFRDVFSEGFAFDSLSSKLTIQNGVMRTDRLQIDGPAARVVMHGEVNLQNETQLLGVNVQPELGGTAALGVALINPVAGVATWVAHKVFQNPLNHMFGFDYRVTGTWDDPKIEKLTTRQPQELPLRLPTISN